VKRFPLFGRISRARRIAAVAALALAPAAPLAAQSISVNAGASNSVVVAPGGKLTVPIIIDLTSAGALNIASLQTGLSWGSAQLTLDSLRVVTATGWTIFPNIGASSLTFAAFNSVALPGTAIIANAFFTASAVSGGTRVMVTPTGAGNDVGTDIFSFIRARSLDVAVAVTVKWGDVNDNNTVDIIDAQQITRFSAGLSVANLTALQQRGDVNADGVVNIIDAQQIARFSVGLSASPRIGTSFVFVPATTAVTLSPNTPQTLLIAKSLQVIATPMSGGTDLTGLAPITWGSSNSAAAVVNSSGFVTGVAAGSANITATSGSITASVGVTVAAVPVASVAVSLAAPAIQTGTTTTATATTRDASNNILTGRAVVFSSSNTGVATVNASTGVVNGVAAGTSTIFATSEGITGSATVTVTTGVPVASVSVVLGSASIQVGATTTGTATTRDASNNVLVGKTITWSSSNPTVATVNASTGVVTGVGGGSANIVATADGVNGQASITVTVAPVASVTVTFGAASVQVAATMQATATLRDAANNVLTGRIVAWSSSNTSIATVNSVTGIVTGVAVGTATIFATSEGITGQAVATVSTTGPVATVIVGLNLISISAGSTTNATATLKDAGNNIVSGTVTWTSSNTAVATVNSSTGLVSGVSAGTANIIGTSGSVSGQKTETVTQVPVATVTVALSPSTIQIAGTVTAVATTLDASNNVLTGRVVAWTSSNTSVATVNSSTGLVTGVALGTATITATSEGRVGQATVTVANVPVATVTVSVASPIAIGGTATAAAVTKDASNNVLTGRVVVWSSSNAGVATVNSSTGVVTGVSVGTANIIATSETKTGQASVSVQSGPSNTIGPAGGTANDAAFVTSVVIPPNALASTLNITVATANNPPADARLLAGTAFDLGPDNTTFTTPYSITIKYTSVPAGFDSTQFRIHKLVNGVWTLLSGTNTVNVTAKTVTAQSSTFSFYAILDVSVAASPPPPPPPPPPPTGGSGSSGSPNEPSGMTVITDRPFNCIKPTACEGDWDWYGSVQPTIVTDNTGPKSSGSVGRVTFAAGFVGGSGQGQTCKVGINMKTMYVAAWIQFSSGFEGHPTGANKIFYIATNNDGTFVLPEADGVFLDPIFPRFVMQNLAAPYQDQGGVMANTVGRLQNVTSGVQIVRGQWHKYEYLLNDNTPGVADGSIDAWQDGVKTFSLPNIMFVGAGTGGTGATWGSVCWQPIWGGQGGLAVNTFYMQVDHIYISGK
jgi:uncharacterized protein YjdB